MSTRFFRIALCTALLAAQAHATPRRAPPDPYIDKGACPFECCTYRDWTTKKQVTLLDRPQGKVKTADIPAGVVVRGMTGEVISHPLAVTAIRAFEDTPIRKGGTYYLLHYAGEGFWSAWYRGRVYSIDMSDYREDTEPMRSFKADWWVKLRSRAGKTGWVLNTGQFDNMDSCG